MPMEGLPEILKVQQRNLDIFEIHPLSQLNQNGTISVGGLT